VPTAVPRFSIRNTRSTLSIKCWSKQIILECRKMVSFKLSVHSNHLISHAFKRCTLQLCEVYQLLIDQGLYQGRAIKVSKSENHICKSVSASVEQVGVLIRVNLITHSSISSITVLGSSTSSLVRLLLLWIPVYCEPCP